MRIRSAAYWAKLVGSLVVFVAGAAFAASTYLSGLAKRSDLDAVQMRVTNNEAELRGVHTELQWIHDQLVEISRAVDAPVVQRR